MSSINSELENVCKELLEVYNSLFNYAIEIGVVSSNADRKEKDITNAQLMFIHENGSYLRNIPKRPVLELTIQYASTKLIPEMLKRVEEGCFKHNWSKEDVKLELEKLCVRMQSYARYVIYQSDLLEKNAPSTIAGKGSDRPLLDTGQLARSITCRLVKIK